MLFEYELQEAPTLCFSCASIYSPADLSAERLTCPVCGFGIERNRYREFYRHAFYAARYGIQYREYYDQAEPDAPKPSLLPLGEISTFVALAVASGVIGNASHEAVKAAIRKIFQQRGKTKEPERFNFTESEIETLIEYLIDYEDGFSKLPERVRHAIVEEIISDAAGDNLVIAQKIAKLVFERENPSPGAKQQAVVLYRELGRRAAVRAKKRPNTPAWKFWDKAGS